MVQGMCALQHLWFPESKQQMMFQRKFVFKWQGDYLVPHPQKYRGSYIAVGSIKS